MWVPSIDPDDHHRSPESHTPDLCVMGSREPYGTGFFDPDGNEIFWVPEPMGFHNPLGTE